MKYASQRPAALPHTMSNSSTVFTSSITAITVKIFLVASMANQLFRILIYDPLENVHFCMDFYYVSKFVPLVIGSDVSHLSRSVSM